MNVIDRPDLIQTFARKDSVSSTSGAAAPHQAAAAEAQDPGKTSKDSPRKEDKDSKEADSPRKDSKDSMKEGEKGEEIHKSMENTGHTYVQPVKTENMNVSYFSGKEDKKDEAKVDRKDSSTSSFSGEYVGDDDEEEEEEEEEDPAQFALPTFLMAGTIFGAIFRVDLTKVKVDVETNNLSEYIISYIGSSCCCPVSGEPAYVIRLPTYNMYK